MTDRWTLNRAGIINVYQYVDETIEFGGGRLLLRGVNGSGKSTAMNMLLPFLLDAQTRRIDAAGEQANVLRAWMLSGREEQQPVGYLWLEFRRGDAFFVCGCGIKANRSTDRVSTWWFTTDRRPGIDLALVEGKVPLSVDALKAVIGAATVFSHDQRNGYRNEIRNRLFGGADLDQHIRLLHVVRNPRVGDRIDVDLPEYLQGALPQLSDAAIDDAAQPLEDLEEHRRNVEALTRTASTLDALSDVYRSYARTELRSRASSQLHLVEHADGRRRIEAAARRDATAARAAFVRAGEAVVDLEATEVRLRNEIAALRESDAYKSGQELDDLRNHVATLARAVDQAQHRLDRCIRRVSEAELAVIAASRVCTADQATIALQLTELEITGQSLSLAVAVPPPPTVITRPLGLEANPDHTPPDAPVEQLQIDREAAQVANVRASALVRRDDVAAVRAALVTVVHHENQLRIAEDDHTRAMVAVGVAATAHTSAVDGLATAVGAWQQQLHGWIDDLNGAARKAGIDPPLDRAVVDIADLAARRHAVSEHLTTKVADVVADHETAATVATRRREVLAAELESLRSEYDELSTRTSPPPPSTGWQRSDRRAVLAELIDFDLNLSPAERVGLESALEAAGLLGAELAGDGSLRASTGELFVVAAASAAAPLSAMLRVTVPDHLRDQIDGAQIDAILDSISTDETSDAPTVVSTDGWFRIGAMTGRWTKPAAEHIGVTARREAVERMLADLTARIETAEISLAGSREAEADCRRRLAAVTAIRRRLPGSTMVTEAIQIVHTAANQLDTCRERTDTTMSAVATTEALYAESAGSMRRTAATLRLPHESDGLDGIDRSLTGIGSLCDSVARELVTLARSVEQWIRAATGWHELVADRVEATVQLRAATNEHDPRAMRLATLEDSVGADYAEVLASLTLSEADSERAVISLGHARAALSAATTLAERQRATAAAAATDLAESERRCIRTIPSLRRALDVPGLVAAATSVDDWPVVVADDIDGARQLATAMLRVIPAAEKDNVTADSVRQSLRQRRATLGAGWDAEDHQPDGDLPLSVEVNGPLGRMPLAPASAEVEIQLRQRSGLLSTQQDQALRNLLQGLIAREVADKMHAAKDLVALMNKRLDTVSTAHGIGAGLRWRRREDLDPTLGGAIDLLAKPPDLRTADEDKILSAALSERIESARRANPEAPYRELIADVLDYKQWHQMSVLVRRPGQAVTVLSRRTPLSEGEKKMVSYLPLFAAVAASSDALAVAAPRFVLLDDAFAKVSEDNHGQLFGLLVEMDLDFIATSERLWGTHASVPELAITEVLRDAELGVIVLEHSHWNGVARTGAT
ncbi:MAG: TIGR02680 family protein [Ilumatobacteraceae bacterium]